MAERKSVNKYYPPDWDPSKGSVNKYVGQHPLRDRAKKIGQGILVIRFEMPYNIWCGGCNSHIGMGVRYNAEKSKVGNYYSTPIYKFRMKCHLCDNYFEIQTDPKNHDYVILEGARRKEQRWDPKENEQIVPEDKATQKKMATDAMFKLEHGSDDVKRGQKAVSSLGSLELRKEEMKDDYMLNKLARQKFRDQKKSLKVAEAVDTALLTKSSLDIPLIQEKDEDVKLAGLLKYRTLESFDEKQTQKRQAIEARPLFSDSKKLKTDTVGKEEHKLDIIKKQVLMSKAARGDGPFNRMVMNSLCPSSSLTCNSLGIRRKSKDKQVTETVTNTNGSEELPESATAELSSSVNDKDSVNISVDTEHEEVETVDNCYTSPSKNNEISGTTSAVIELKDTADTDTENNDINVVEKDNDDVKADSVLVHVTASKNTSLSLVSSYSDSDTDSSTT